jgi:hypothetical protein
MTARAITANLRDLPTVGKSANVGLLEPFPRLLGSAERLCGSFDSAQTQRVKSGKAATISLKSAASRDGT